MNPRQRAQEVLRLVTEMREAINPQTGRRFTLKEIASLVGRSHSWVRVICHFARSGKGVSPHTLYLVQRAADSLRTEDTMPHTDREIIISQRTLDLLLAHRRKGETLDDTLQRLLNEKEK